MTYRDSPLKMLYDHSPFFVKNLFCSTYGWMQKRDRYGKYYRYYLEYLQESQWHPNEKLVERQFSRTKRFLIHAGLHSKFYTDLFKRNDFYPERIESFAELQTLPILKKEIVRRAAREIMTDNWRRDDVRWAHTSGTTGTGLRLPVSTECFQREYAFSDLHFLWGNIKHGGRWAFCSGHPVASQDRGIPPFWVYDYVNNCLFLSSYHLSEKNLRSYISELGKFQPNLLAGYPSSIYILAIANEEYGRRIRPEAIFVSSETLFQYQREQIEKSFGAKVFSFYGNSEMCANIVECQKNRLHMKLEHSFVEVLDENNETVLPGRQGQLVCTAFGNYVFPLIRYSIGDIIVTSRDSICECGRSGILVDYIIGRIEDYILTDDGRYVGRLDHIFKESTHVKMAQIVQNEMGKVIIRIVKDESYRSSDEREILDKARLRLGTKIMVEIEYVNDIERTKNGKYRFIVSNVNNKEIFSRIL